MKHNLGETAKQLGEERPWLGNLPIGLLNLSRAHRNWLDQVRPVILHVSHLRVYSPSSHLLRVK